MTHFQASDGTHFNFNSDLSGDVLITYDNGSVERLNASGAALIELVAEYVRRRRIAEIEDASTAELLGLDTP